MSPWDDISRAVAAATGKPFKINQRASVGGGCINSAYRIEGGETGYFLKLSLAPFSCLRQAGRLISELLASA